MVTYDIVGDLLSRKNKIVIKNIEEVDCEKAIDDLTRKGWINLKVVKSKPKLKKKDEQQTLSSSSRKSRTRRNSRLDGRKKTTTKDDSKTAS
jgi:hypothetical protein